MTDHAIQELIGAVSGAANNSTSRPDPPPAHSGINNCSSKTTNFSDFSRPNSQSPILNEKEAANDHCVIDKQKEFLEAERQKQYAYLLNSERERQKQQLMFTRVIEQQKKLEEKTRQQVHKQQEKQSNKQRKLEQKMIESRLAQELKTANEDLILANSKPLPDLSTFDSNRLSSQALGDCLMMVEFLNTFSEALCIDPETIPTLGTFQGALVDCNAVCQDSISTLLIELLKFAVCDPGIPNPRIVTQMLGLRFSDMQINCDTLSSVLRMFIIARNGLEDDMSDWLSNSASFHDLTADQQASIISFLCHELLSSRLISGEVDRNIEQQSILRREKWSVDNKMRKLRNVNTRKFGSLNSNCQNADLPPANSFENGQCGNDTNSQTTSTCETTQNNGYCFNSQSKTDRENSYCGGDEESGNESDETHITSNLSGDEDDIGSAEELDKRIDKLTNQSTSKQAAIVDCNYRLRGIYLGQDRYRRNYFALGRLGGIFVQGLSQNQKEEYFDADDFIKELRKRKELHAAKRKARNKDLSIFGGKNSTPVIVKEEEEQIKNEDSVNKLPENIKVENIILEMAENEDATSAVKLEKTPFKEEYSEEKMEILKDKTNGVIDKDKFSEKTGKETPKIIEKEAPKITEEETPEITEDETPEITKEGTLEITEDESPEITKEGTLEITEDESPEITKEETPEITKEGTLEITEDESPEITKEGTPEITEDESPEITKEETPEITKEGTLEITEDESPEITKEGTPEITEDESPEITKEGTPEKMQEDTPEKMQEETSDIMVEDTPGKFQEDTPEKMQEETSDLVVEEAPFKKSDIMINSQEIILQSSSNLSHESNTVLQEQSYPNTDEEIPEPTRTTEYQMITEINQDNWESNNEEMTEKSDDPVFTIDHVTKEYNNTELEASQNMELSQSPSGLVENCPTIVNTNGKQNFKEKSDSNSAVDSSDEHSQTSDKSNPAKPEKQNTKSINSNSNQIRSGANEIASVQKLANNEEDSLNNKDENNSTTIEKSAISNGLSKDMCDTSGSVDAFQNILTDCIQSCFDQCKLLTKTDGKIEKVIEDCLDLTKKSNLILRNNLKLEQEEPLNLSMKNNCNESTLPGLNFQKMNSQSETLDNNIDDLSKSLINSDLKIDEALFSNAAFIYASQASMMCPDVSISQLQAFYKDELMKAALTYSDSSTIDNLRSWMTYYQSMFNDNASLVNPSTADIKVEANSDSPVPEPAQMTEEEIDKVVHNEMIHNGVELNEQLSIPIDMKSNWWKIDSEEKLRQLQSCFAQRGIREKNLLRLMHKFEEIIISSMAKSSSCNALAFDIPKRSGKLKVRSKRGKARGINRRESTSILSELSEEYQSDETFVTECLHLEEVEALEDRVLNASLQTKGWQAPLKIVDDDTIHLVSKVTKKKSRFEHYPLDLCKERLLALEQHMERRYLLPPLNKEPHLDLVDGSPADGIDGFSRDDPTTNEDSKFCDDSISECCDDTIVSSSSFNNGRNNSKRLKRQETETEDEENLPLGLIQWRQSVSKCMTSEQFKTCLDILIKAVAWDKSIMKVLCQICRKDNNEAQLLLCDGCDRGYHTYCFRPPLTKIPTGDWFCYDCVSKATNKRHCFVCGQTADTSIGQSRGAVCDHCSRMVHMDCSKPALTRIPRKWLCAVCQEMNVTSSRAVIPNTSNQTTVPSSVTVQNTTSTSAPTSPVKKTCTKRSRTTATSSKAANNLPKSNESCLNPPNPNNLSESKTLSGSEDNLTDTASISSSCDNTNPPSSKKPRLNSIDIPEEPWCERDSLVSLKILTELESHQFSWPFLKPVNSKQVPFYKKVIKTPMDFSTVRKQTSENKYKTKSEFIRDIRLIFDNCEIFNEDDSEVGQCGHKMRVVFEDLWPKMEQEFYFMSSNECELSNCKPSSEDSSVTKSTSSSSVSGNFAAPDLTSDELSDCHRPPSSLNINTTNNSSKQRKSIKSCPTSPCVSSNVNDASSISIIDKTSKRIPLASTCSIAQRKRSSSPILLSNNSTS